MRGLTQRASPVSTIEALPSRDLVEHAVTLGILIVLLVAVTNSVVEAEWVDEMPDLRLLAVIALGMAALVAPLRGHWLPLLGGGLLIGSIIVLWQVLSVDSISDQPFFWARFDDLGSRLSDWFSQAFNSGITTDNLPFVLFVVAVVWGAAFLGSFVMLRWNNAWFLILILAAIIAINLAYADGDQWDTNFGIFMGAAAVLVVRAHLLRRLARWRAQGLEVPTYLSWYALTTGVLLVALLVGSSRAAPRPDESEALASVWDRVTDPFSVLRDEVDRLFTGPGAGQAQALHAFGNGFALQANIDPGESVVVQATAPEMGLLRGSAYDRYTGRGWLQSQDSPAPVSAGQAFPIDPPAGVFGYNDRRDVTTVILVVRSPRVYFSLGQPVVLDEDAEVAQTAEAVVRVEVGNPRVPGVAADLADALREIDILQERSELSDVAAVSLLPSGYEVLQIERGSDGIAAFVVRSAPAEPDVLAVRSTDFIRASTEYAISGSVSSASEESLRVAGNAYPQWVLARNLQLPAELTDEEFQRLQALALAVTSAADTPYDAVVALESYLCCTSRVDDAGEAIRDENGTPIPLYPFDPLIPEAPPLTDAVTWFLFEVKDDDGLPFGGYYDYHASAMAVLLRSLGIPARISTGYVLNEGNFDRQSGSFIVRGKHAYTWVEVFFPDYGWVDFDPTPVVTDEAFSDIQGRRLGEQREAPVDSDVTEENSDPRLGGPSASLDNPDLPLDMEESQASEQTSSGGSSSIVWIVVLAVLGAVVVSGVGGRLVWEWSLRGLSPTERSWASLHLLSRWAGLAGSPSETPTEFGESLGENLSASADAERLAQNYVHVRYGRGVLEVQEITRMRQSYRLLRGRLWRRILRSVMRPRRPRLRRLL